MLFGIKKIKHSSSLSLLLHGKKNQNNINSEKKNKISAKKKKYFDEK
jgi:hypothetical protein